MEQKQPISDINDPHNFLVMPEEEKKKIMALLKQQAKNEGIDIAKSGFSEQEILELFTMEPDLLIPYLNVYIEEKLLDVQTKIKRGLSNKDTFAERTCLTNAVKFIGDFVKKCNQPTEDSNRKRKEPETAQNQTSNRYLFNNSNKKIKENSNNENSSQNNLSEEEKNKIIDDLKKDMGEDIFNAVLIVYNAFKYKHETLFNLLQKDLETALEELNEQLLTDIEVTMYELKQENKLEKSTQELHKASAILSNVAKGYDILTSYVEKYIAEHQPSSPSPTPYQE